MRSIYSIFTCLFLAITLAGCGPIYQTHYSYVPPHSSVGKMCIAQCVQSKSTCQQMCQMKEQNCQYQSREEARYSYSEYKHDRKKHGKAVKKELRDFDSGRYSCHQSCDCDETFNSCYDACGGKVVESRVCTMFCDKQ